MSRAYPLPRPAAGEEPRFAHDLVLDVADLLEQYHFPQVTDAGDLAALRQALFGFLYESKESPR